MKEKGECGDTCVLPVGSFSVLCGVSASGLGDGIGEWRSGPGEWLLWPLSPGGLLCENPAVGCVCMV